PHDLVGRAAIARFSLRTELSGAGRRGRGVLGRLPPREDRSAARGGSGGRRLAMGEELRPGRPTGRPRRLRLLPLAGAGRHDAALAAVGPAKAAPMTSAAVAERETQDTRITDPHASGPSRSGADPR